MFSSKASCFFLFSFFSLSTNAQTVRGVHRELLEAKVELGSAGNYVILTKAGISTVPSSVITGDIAVSPIAATAMTGFSLIANTDGEYTKSVQITGTSSAYAANYAVPTPALLTTAVSNMEAAYTDAAGRPQGVGPQLNLGAGILGVGGLNGGTAAKLTPGVYTFGSDVTIAETIYFDGGGDASAIFIIQMTGDLSQVANTQVLLLNQAKAENIFWQVAGAVTVEAGAQIQGILLVKTAVLFKTGSSLNGRILAQTACDLQMATITQPAE